MIHTDRSIPLTDAKLDRNANSLCSDVVYIAQYGYIGGTVADPVAYWQDDHRSYDTASEALERLEELRPTKGEPSRWQTGQLRIVKRTVVVTTEPLEV